MLVIIFCPFFLYKKTSERVGIFKWKLFCLGVVPINTFANKKVSNVTVEDIEDQEDEGIHKLIDIFWSHATYSYPGKFKNLLWKSICHTL